MTLAHRTGVLAVLVCSLTLAGCNTAKTAIGTPARFNGLTGELTADVGVTLDRAFAAAQDAIDELQFRVTDQEKDALAGTISALRADGTKVNLALNRQSGEVTRIVINVGPLGQQATARAVIDTIEAHL